MAVRQVVMEYSVPHKGLFCFLEGNVCAGQSPSLKAIREEGRQLHNASTGSSSRRRLTAIRSGGSVILAAALMLRQSLQTLGLCSFKSSVFNLESHVTGPSVRTTCASRIGEQAFYLH